MTRRINTVRRVRALPGRLAQLAMLGVSMLLPIAIVVGAVTG